MVNYSSRRMKPVKKTRAVANRGKWVIGGSLSEHHNASLDHCTPAARVNNVEDIHPE